MASVRLVERFNGALSNCRVDEDAGIIHGAVLCGFTSANGRDYPRHVLEAATPKYLGCKIHLNHSRDGRTLQEWVGVIEDPKPGPDGRPRGRLELFKSDPYVPKLLEAARRYPNKFGLSHVAMAKTTRRSGREVVESIDRIESVDFVTDPATVKGLFESVQRGQAMTSAAKSAAVRLLESFQATAPAGLRQSLRQVLVELDAKQHRDAATNAFREAGIAVWVSLLSGELDLNAALDKLRQLHKSFVATGANPADPNDPLPATEGRVTTRAAFVESIRPGYVPASRSDFLHSIRS